MTPCWRGSRAGRRPTALPRSSSTACLPAHGISLTDRAGCAACLVAEAPAAIGCDLELVEPRSDAFVADYLTGPERDLVASAGQARDVAANLIWSAKESALKVLRTGLRRDTRSVEVSVPDLTPAEHVWSAFSVRTAEGTVFAGWWRRSGSFLLTTCARGAFPLPAAIDAVCALDGASPSHRWLGRPLRSADADCLRLRARPPVRRPGEPSPSRRSSAPMMNGRSSAGGMMRSTDPTRMARWMS